MRRNTAGVTAVRRRLSIHYTRRGGGRVRVTARIFALCTPHFYDAYLFCRCTLRLRGKRAVVLTAFALIAALFAIALTGRRGAAELLLPIMTS